MKQGKRNQAKKFENGFSNTSYMGFKTPDYSNCTNKKRINSFISSQ
jgi:hypothetical protein